MSIELICTITTSLVAVVAVIIPIITTYISNKHQLKLHKLSVYVDKKLSLYQEFLDIMENTLVVRTMPIKLSLQQKQSFSKVYLICSSQTRELLDELRFCIITSDDPSSAQCTSEYQQLEFKLVVSMRNELQKDLNPYINQRNKSR